MPKWSNPHELFVWTLSTVGLAIFWHCYHVLLRTGDSKSDISAICLWIKTNRIRFSIGQIWYMRWSANDSARMTRGAEKQLFRSTADRKRSHSVCLVFDGHFANTRVQDLNVINLDIAIGAGSP